MDQIYPDDGLDEILKRFVRDSFMYHLFVNDRFPTLGDTLANYVEAAWSSYAAQLVLAGSFVIDPTVSNVGAIEAPLVSFANTTGVTQKAFGFYVTREDNTKLIAVARFDDAPIDILDGDVLPVLPIFGTYSGLTS